ncbi:LysR family transcriptional regulator, partial [Streptomyces diastaticus]
MSMNTTNIALIAAIRDRGSIAAAARAVHMSPAAAARRITAMESEIGGPLVNRSARSTDLTALGRRYLTWGADARSRFESLPDYGDDNATRTVYVAVLGMALGPVGPAIMDEWRARFPTTTLVEMPVTSHSIGDPLAQGADIVFGQLLGDEAQALGWQTHVTARSERAVVVPAFSDYADAPGLTPPELEDEHWLYALAGDARHARWMSDLPV